jgi:hypothetical protein
MGKKKAHGPLTAAAASAAPACEDVLAKIEGILKPITDGPEQFFAPNASLAERLRHATKALFDYCKLSLRPPPHISYSCCVSAYSQHHAMRICKPGSVLIQLLSLCFLF